MTISHDAQTRWPVTDSTGLDTTTGDRTFNHAGGASCKGAVVIVQSNASTAPCTGVTYGGIAMASIVAAVDTSEAGYIQIFALTEESPFPTGTQEVVLQGCDASSKWATASTVNCSVENSTKVNASNKVDTTTAANPLVTVVTSATCLLYGAVHGGLASPGGYVAAANHTIQFSGDYGARSSRSARRTAEVAAGSVDFTFTATSEDWCIAAVALEEEAAAASVSSDLDLRWQTSGRITSDVDLRWATAGTPAPISSDVELRWQTSTLVTSDIDLRWQTATSVSSDVEARWTTRGRVTSDVEAQWITRAEVDSDLELRWTTRGRITSDVDLRWIVTGAGFHAPARTQVLKVSGFDFSDIPDGSEIQGITARINTFYRSGSGAGQLDLCQLLDTSGARVGTNQAATPVPLTSATSTIITKGGSSDTWGNALTAAWVKHPNFGIALAVQATEQDAAVDVDYVTLEIQYAAAQTTPVSSDLDLRWRTLTAVSSDLELRWQTSVLVNSDLDARWQTLAALSSDLDLRWVTDGTPGVVNSDLDLRWRTRAQVSSDADIRWRTSARVTADHDLRWRTLAAVTSDIDLRWQTLATLTSDLDLRWTTRERITSDVDLRWRTFVGVAVDSDLDLRWRTLARITADHDLRWRTRARTLASLDIRWATKTRITGDHDLRWRTLTGVTADLELRWRTLAGVNSDLDLRWVTVGRVNSDLELRWLVVSLTAEPLYTVQALPARWGIETSTGHRTAEPTQDRWDADSSPARWDTQPQPGRYTVEPARP